jgi:hypothetical protein
LPVEKKTQSNGWFQCRHPIIYAVVVLRCRCDKSRVELVAVGLPLDVSSPGHLEVPPPGYFEVQFTMAVASKYRHQHSIRTLNQVEAVAYLWDDDERIMSAREVVDGPSGVYHLLQDNPLDNNFYLKEINIGEGKIAISNPLA